MGMPAFEITSFWLAWGLHALGLYYPYTEILAFFGNDRIRADAFVQMRVGQAKGSLDFPKKTSTHVSKLESQLLSPSKNKHGSQRSIDHHLPVLLEAKAPHLHQKFGHLA